MNASKRPGAELKLRKPCVLWFTGLPAAGKTTLACALSGELISRGVHCCTLDGDDLRRTLNTDLGFSDADRMENMRRAAEVAKLFLRERYLAIVSLISPLRRQRLKVKSLFNPDEFLEVYVDASQAVCESRDPKGLYRRARANKLLNFTGVDAKYEPPTLPDLHLHTECESPTALVDKAIRCLISHDILIQDHS